MIPAFEKFFFPRLKHIEGDKQYSLKDLRDICAVHFALSEDDLAEKKRTNKWLADTIGKDPAPTSKWCTNSAQPNLEIAKCLEVDLNELVRFK